MATQPREPEPKQGRDDRDRRPPKGVTQPHTRDTPEPAPSYPFGQEGGSPRTITQDEQERVQQAPDNDVPMPKRKTEDPWES